MTHFYSLTHLHSERPKEAWRFWKYFPYKSILLKTIEWEVLIRIQTTNLLQIFCEISLHSQVIFKSMKVADDISRGTLEYEWVKLQLTISASLTGLDCLTLARRHPVGSQSGYCSVNSRELILAATLAFFLWFLSSSKLFQVAQVLSIIIELYYFCFYLIST